MLMLLNPVLMSVIWTVGFGSVEETKKATALEGKWKVVSVHYDKKKTIARSLKQGDTFTVNGAAYRLNGATHKEAGTLKMDGTQSPATVDLDDGNRQGSRGIYRIDGAKLVFCLWSGDRPKAFESGPKAILVEFERAK